MGSVGSKSPLERRNTVARRSQRRTLHNLKPKVEQLHKDIKKFKGATEDVNWVSLRNEIEFFKNDLTRRAKDLQPQVRNLYENVYKRVCEAEEALQTKLEENREKLTNKQQKGDNNEVAQSIISQNQSETFSEITSNNTADNETIVDVHAENENDNKKNMEIQLEHLEGSPKHTKEVRIISPEQKRKSILKVGVPVMPVAMMNELAAQTTRINRQYDRTDSPVPARTVQEVVERINEIVESLRQIELEINEFVGKKNGKQYLRFRDSLNKYLIELNGLSPVDDYALDQIKICRSYIGSCLSFLDERATSEARPESFTSDDEVFNNNNVVTPQMVKVEENFRMHRLLKNTAV
ncbi:unnamed protein product [Ceutorhynchus assimilis]|uniref:Uncharacterized protein n=1 Tax=Ceutorhynchus assimilis TaxID=467358 RepID=A0A9N9MZV1_9CUCU|nr:unnamed protein product [Ceutorhynchus assimilis]